jgi:hypothetical protein
MIPNAHKTKKNLFSYWKVVGKSFSGKGKPTTTTTKAKAFTKIQKTRNERERTNGFPLEKRESKEVENLKK